MKYFLTSLLVVSCVAAYAQPKDADCSYHYFKTGKVSTSECYSKERFKSGSAKAFNRKGEVIYEKSIRRFAGSSSVTFQYYDDGAVKRADWHEAPDAGIQWYSSVTTFSEDGKITDVQEQSYDMHATVPATVRKEPPVKPKQAETIRCAEIWVSEMWFINKVRYAVTVYAEKLSADKSGSATVTLQPGDTAKCGEMIQAQYFQNPDIYFSTSATAVRQRKGRHPGIAFLKDAPYPGQKDKRKYYFTIQ